ncbi:M16 family metallopeptidase [Pontimicrobium sp. IMCC45349]|uniref:M16 family metallopeptidase n=1 Tax=Pontimicrobium sp. IMCC45349 TaxID=3391574 RepID=UPI0039A2819F
MRTIFNIKTKISAFVLLFLVTLSVTAQVDRTKIPTPGAEPEINIKTPEEFQLKNGLKVLVVENHKLPRVSFSLRIDNGPILSGDKAGVESIVASMLGNGTTSIDKDTFNEEIDFLGANLSFGSSSAFASSLSKYSERILELMADAALNPLLTEEEFQKEKDKLLESLKSNEKSMDAISGRVGGALSYGTHHPYGEFTTEETVNNVTLDNVRAFYQKYFSPNKAYLVVIGDVKFKDIKKQVKKYFGDWAPGAGVATSIPEVNPNAQYTQINFVDFPSASQSSISITNNVKLKMADEDYHAALITNNILGGGGEGYLFKNLREEHGYTYGAYSSLGANRYGASRFTASAKVRNMVTDSAVVEALKEIKRIKTEPVDAQILKDAKEKYIGRFIMGLENPRTVANYALNIKLQNLPQDFYSTYLQKIKDVSVEDVQRVANKYFKTENARIVIVGKGADALENLEKTGIPIKYYDKYANEVAKPEFTKPIPAGVTVQTVIDNYINAIGGKDKLAAVNTIHSTANVTIEGAPFKPVANTKQMAPNKMMVDISIEGMGTIEKQVFNGETGYIVRQGQRQDMPADRIESQKKSVLFDELGFADKNVTLESINTIEGNDVYKVKLEENGETTYRYYSVENAFLVRTESTTKVGEQEITTTVDYDKYSEVEGVLFPYYTVQKAGPQVLIFNVSNIKVNEGVTDADFN